MEEALALVDRQVLHQFATAGEGVAGATDALPSGECARAEVLVGPDEVATGPTATSSTRCSSC